MDINLEMIKKELAMMYKARMLITSGTDACNSLIGIEEIIKKAVSQLEIDILDKAGYKFFNITAMKKYINSLYKEDEKQLQIELINLEEQEKEFRRLEKEFKELYVAIVEFRARGVSIKKNIYLFNVEDIKKEKNVKEKFELAQEFIDFKKIDMLIKTARRTLRYKINSQVEKYNKGEIKNKDGQILRLEESQEYREALNKRFNSLPTADTITSNVKFDNELILDISDEFLLNEDFLEKLIKLIKKDKNKEIFEEIRKIVEETNTIKNKEILDFLERFNTSVIFENNEFENEYEEFKKIIISSSAIEDLLKKARGLKVYLSGDNKEYIDKLVKNIKNSVSVKIWRKSKDIKASINTNNQDKYKIAISDIKKLLEDKDDKILLSKIENLENLIIKGKKELLIQKLEELKIKN